MRFSWNIIFRNCAIGLAAIAQFAIPATAPAQGRLASPTPDWQSLTPEQAIQGCDDYASHPLDPLKPEDVAGVAADDEINQDAAYIYCHRALQADQENPRILFQWGRVNLVRNPALTSQPRHMFRLAYGKGSEIAGIYLAKLPPEQPDAELQESVRQSMQTIKDNQSTTAIVGTPTADQIVASSLVLITSVALLRILSGEASFSDQECSGGFDLNTNTHELLCNGLVVGQL